MAIKYPALCTTDASRQVFCLEYADKLQAWHNTQCFGMTASEAKAWRQANYYAKEKKILHARNFLQESVVVTAKWKPVIATAIVDGAIVYDAGINLDNESSMLAYLFELQQKLREDARDMEFDKDAKLVRHEIARVRALAKTRAYWKPDLGDVS